jgi:transcriptional regulator with XRE-family HTH domain
LTLGECLKEARKMRGMTLIGVSRAAGVSVSHMSQIERGESMPSIETLLDVLDVYDINILFGDEKRFVSYIVSKK